MAEPLLPPVTISDRPADPVEYRPLSLLAVAGLVIGIAYSLIVLVGALNAFRVGSPLLLPGVLSVGLPVLGAVLSLAAIRQIRSSENTYAGIGLATLGWWLSLLAGLGYGAYYAATYFAVVNQANQFVVNRWMELLKKGNTNAAFLLTQEPSQQDMVKSAQDDAYMNMRFNVSPDPSRPGMLDMFRRHDVVFTVIQGGAETEIKPLGVENWEYKNGSFHVQRQYRLTTPDGEYTVSIGVARTSSRKGEWEGPRWTVSWQDVSMLPGFRLTERGRQRLVLRERGTQFLMAWGQKLTEQRYVEAFLDLCPPADRVRLYTVFQVRRILLPAFGPMPWSKLMLLANPAFELSAYMPDYAKVIEETLKIDERRFQAPDEATRKQYLGATRTMFQPPLYADSPRLMGLRAQTSSTRYPVPVIKGDRIQLSQDCELGFAPGFRCDIIVTAETSADLTQTTAPWQIVRIEPFRGMDMSRSRGLSGLESM